MFRKDLIPLLQDRSYTVTELARLAGQTGRETADDIEHLLKSLKHTDLKAEVLPAVCRKCGFEFGTDKLRKPSRCPECQSSWLHEPRIQISRSQKAD